MHLPAGRRAVEPHIFGTPFERSLDPSKRAQIGAHYTGRDDILLVLEPVVMQPLRREWDKVKSDIAALLVKRGADIELYHLFASLTPRGQDEG
jgi:hypothetical protein